MTIFDRYKFFLDFNFLIKETPVVIKEMPIVNASSGLVIADHGVSGVNGDRGRKGE